MTLHPRREGAVTTTDAIADGTFDADADEEVVVPADESPNEAVEC
jgi:hypothetical protein